MSQLELKQLRTKIGLAIRRLRSEERVSATYLAKVLGVSQSTISRVESGALSISAESLCFLAKSFNRPLSFFVGGQSSVVHSELDLVRAGLVRFGATHLKAKKTIDADSAWKSYADLLAEALAYARDARIAAAIAATLYARSSKDDINEMRIIATLQSKRLAAGLVALIEILDASAPAINDAKLNKERALKRLRSLSDEVVDEYKVGVEGAILANISAQYVADFINESLGHERIL